MLRIIMIHIIVQVMKEPPSSFFQFFVCGTVLNQIMNVNELKEAAEKHESWREFAISAGYVNVPETRIIWGSPYAFTSTK